MYKEKKIAFIGDSFGSGSGPLKRANKLSEKVQVDIIFYYGFHRLNKNIPNQPGVAEDLFNKRIKKMSNDFKGEFYEIGAKSNYDIKNIYKLYCLLRDNKYDAVFCHHNYTGIISVLCAFAAKVDRIIKVEMSDVRRKKSYIRLLTSLSYLLCRNIICISKSTEASMGIMEKAFSNYKRQVIYNGIDLDSVNHYTNNYSNTLVRSEFNFSNKDLLIFTAGRLHKVKNYDLLIRSFKLVIDKSVNSKLVIAGAGPEKGRLEELASDLGIEDKVIFAGHVSIDKVYKLMIASDIYVMTSKSEGFSESLLQAMAFGLPIVATDIPSFSEALSNDAGIISKPNSIDFSRNILSLIYDIKLQFLYSSTAERKSKEYDINAVIEKYTKIIL